MLKPTRLAISADAKTIGLGLAVVSVVVGAIVLVLQNASYDVSGALWVAPVLVAISIPILAREARRQEDPHVFRLLMLALILKLIGSIVRYYVSFHVYASGGDALGYHQAGVRWAGSLLAGEFHAHGQSLTGTNFVELVTGIVYTVIRPTLLGGFLVFSWLSFLGLFFFYRAFVIAIPEGRVASYAHLLFFLPSLLFWPSGPGKEAWMMFALGIAAFGSASVLTGRIGKGIGLTGLGVWFAFLVRPHVAGIFLAAFLAALLVSLLTRRMAVAGRVRLLVPAALLVVTTLVVIANAERYLQEESKVDTSGGVTTTLGEVEERTAQGGSRFTAPLIDSPAGVPLAALTVLFRPTPVEATNVQALISALEASVLFILTVWRLHWVVAAIRSIRRQAYVLIALVYTALFIVAFSSIANFGILVRQRVQLLPFYLVLLAIPPKPAPVNTGEVARSSNAEDSDRSWPRERKRSGVGG